jgi:endonuclease/exonuclease/phosphatase family metal-dependent hydrolase
MNVLNTNIKMFWAVLFAIGFFSFYSATAQERAVKLKVLSYNIHIGNPPSQPGVTDLSGIAKVINESDADLVALQEVDVYTNRSGKDLDQAQELAKLTDRHYYFAKTIDHDGGKYGIAVLSKFPIVKKESHFLPIAEGVRCEQRAVAIVTVEIEKGVFLDFATTHFDLTPQTRMLQSAFIIDLVQKRNRPLLLGGDFNATPNTEEIRLLDSYFKRSAVPNGFTIPVGNPTREIDFVMYAPESNFKVERHEVIEEHFASDHLPVFVEIVFSIKE